MIKTILIAFDGSDQSRKAFDLGLAIAVKFQARLLVVGVIRLPEPAVLVEIDAMLDRGRAHFEEEFSALRERATAGVEFDTRVAVGTRRNTSCARPRTPPPTSSSWGGGARRV
jgi:nucleotide-binding universal stress UspA family protein